MVWWQIQNEIGEKGQNEIKSTNRTTMIYKQNNKNNEIRNLGWAIKHGRRRHQYRLIHLIT